MVKTGTKTYWLLMMTAACLTVGCSLMLTESYASARSEAVWQTGLQTSAVTVSSDYLSENGQTVLLDPLTQERTLSFTLTTSHMERAGTLTWTVTPENALTVQAPDAAIAAAAGTKVDMTLTPGEVAQVTQATLSLCWSAETGEKLQGSFVIPLPGQEASEQETQVSQPTELDASMAVMKEFVAGSAIVVTVSHPSDAQLVSLSMAGEPFPAGTRYCTEYGLEETVLYDPAKICLQLDGGKQTVVLLTLPKAAYPEELTLQADITSESGASCLQAKTACVAGSFDLPNSYFYELNGDDAFTLTMPAGWGGCTLTYTVQKLTETEDGIQYETVTNTGSQSLSVTGGADEITVSLTETDMQAGTYRLQLVWNYQTYTVARQQVTFHISYPERFAAATAGGNEL